VAVDGGLGDLAGANQVLVNVRLPTHRVWRFKEFFGTHIESVNLRSETGRNHRRAVFDDSYIHYKNRKYKSLKSSCSCTEDRAKLAPPQIACFSARLHRE
jgi:hypothetical protein